MRKTYWLLVMTMLLSLLAACGDGEDKVTEEDDELKMLEVDFDVPEKADPGDTVTLTADVTYGDDPVPDADEVQFEIWEKGKEDDSEKIDGENHEDGSYSIDYTFEQEGIYEMYAHTTAHSQHTMPKKQLNVGDVEETEEEDAGEDHFHTDGFDMEFTEPESITEGDATEFITHISMEEDALENLKVRYEIWPSDDEEAIEWADAGEKSAGEYHGSYKFPKAGTYEIQVHVQDDEDLHEHKTYEVNVQ